MIVMTLGTVVMVDSWMQRKMKIIQWETGKYIRECFCETKSVGKFKYHTQCEVSSVWCVNVTKRHLNECSSDFPSAIVLHEAHIQHVPHIIQAR